MKKYITSVLAVFLFLSILISSDSKEFEISKNVEIFISILDELNSNYVDNIKAGQIIRKGIDAMLESLDPYTVYYSESEVEDYQIQITGKYGGIGSLINKDSTHVYIAEPYEGFPAHKSGLRAGDRILAIGHKNVIGKNTTEVSKLLKGAPNTSIDLKIKRPYIKEPIELKITREEVKLHAVPYSCILDSNIAYVKLTKFTRNCGNEVRTAFKSLMDSTHIKSCILDLRGNSGGLLLEAVNVSNIFIPKGEVIVSTIGKKLEKDYKSLNIALDTIIPLAVLTNKGSASASEIVSGAIQDMDRGVIIGQRTYGKGLVQNTRPVGYNTQIKLTTAKYYIPSGRCIQKIDYSNKDEEGSSKATPDSLINAFKTRAGRNVYDGKGIKPDIELENRKYSQILKSLLSNRLIFDFATYYRSKHDSSAYQSHSMDDNLYNSFIDFIKDKDYEYETKSEDILNNLIKRSKEEKYFDAMSEEIKELQKSLEEDKAKDIQKFKDQVKQYLNEEIVSRFEYQKGRIRIKLQDDPELNKAIEILNNPKEYQSILSVRQN